MAEILGIIKNFGLGGSQKMTTRIAKAFADEGSNVTLMPVTEGKSFLKDNLDPKIHVLDYEDTIDWKNFTQRLEKYLAEHHVDVIFSSNTHVNTILCLLKAQGALPEGTSVVIRPDNPLDSWRNEQHPFRDVIHDLTVNLVFPHADLIIGQCPALADNTKKYVTHDANIVVIPNPTLDLEHKDKIVSPSDHPWLQPTRNHRTLIAVGRVTAVKGFDTLIQAFAEVHKKSPDTKLVIVGEGDEKEHLQTLIHSLGIQDSVDLCGKVDNPDHYVAYADLFVLSSHSEGLPNALIEAMSLGLDFVATDCQTGPKDISENGHFGHIVPVGDHQLMAKAILDALEHPLSEEEKQEQIDHVYGKYTLENFKTNLMRELSERHIM